MTQERLLTICHLYPREMNVCGDHGNRLALEQRMRWGGIIPKLLEYHPGDSFPGDVDLILGGGGQDSGQLIVAADVPRIAEPILELIEAGTPALVVCGMFQLFGTHIAITSEQVVGGIGVFDAHTVNEKGRIVGNAVVETDDLGTIIGYENHSGRTHLGPTAIPLGRVVVGTGNNDTSKTEGVRHKNALGTYLHGPLLPLNPHLTDSLISIAVENKYQESAQLSALPYIDELTDGVRNTIKVRPR